MLIDARQVVSHAVVAATGVAVGVVSLAGFGYGLYIGSDFALHFAVRSALWGFLLPVFFAVCHRMIPFFSQNAIPGYVAWRPLWILVAVVGLAYARLLLGTAGALDSLVFLDVALAILAATCAVRWTSLGARGNPLLWTLYAGFAWLPVAMALQAGRDASFALTGEWALGRAPIHALGIGFFGGMLVAMVTRVTMGHSGRPLRMAPAALACFAGVQLAAVARVGSEIATAPGVIREPAARQRGAVAAGVRRMVIRSRRHLSRAARGRQAGMSEYYFTLRSVHIACAVLTISLFAVRGMLMLAESPLLAHRALRWTPIAVDTVLLTTALMLMGIIHQYPFTTPWLTAKIGLLVAYMVLGSIALRYGRTKRMRMAALLGALATVAFLVTVARTHQPLGILAG